MMQVGQGGCWERDVRIIGKGRDTAMAREVR